MRKALLCATSVLFLASGLFAQPLTETIEVRVANIDVVVTDREGHPIHGLTKDDFELYENRKLQSITNIYEERGEAPAAGTASGTVASAPAPAEIRQRSIVVFIDNTSIDPLRRNQAIDVIVRALDALLRPGDDAMLVAWNQNLEVLQPFTTDVALLKRTLDKSRKFTSSVSNLQWQKNEAVSFANSMIQAAQTGRMRPADAYSSAISKVRSYAEFVLQTERGLLRSMSRTIALLSGIEGKKVLVFVGAELQERPGLDVFQIVDSMFVGLIRTAPAILRDADINTTTQLQEVARNANANGVTMYMLDVSDRSRSSAEGSLPDPEVEFTQQTNSFFSMSMLASNTGGSLLSGSTNYALALNNIARDLGSYYSLGYKPPADGGVDRSISVKVKRAGAVVRTRHGYALKSADEQMQDRVVANAFHTTLKGDFPVKIETSKPEPFEKGLFKVIVTLTFPSDLTYLPDGENLSGGYTVFFVTAAEDGALSPVAKQSQDVKFPAATAEAVKQKPFTHTTGLIVRPGSQSISVAILDRLGARVGYARAAFIAR
ncbi:MAG TPA: VWA domain-containing protein [Thermoanaerobaculia bacterium]|nr:VWA domain-containing protein [Thermoanaerobaculia bacterium]